MAWTKYQFFLAGMMLITGAINTLSTKWADKTTSVGCGKYGKEYVDVPRTFDHPFVQAVGMFIGEFSCLLFFKLIFSIWRQKTQRGEQVGDGIARLVDGNQDFSPLVFWPAALLDMFGTSISYVALNMTDASSFQMLRGSVIVFTALLSVTFLQRQIKLQMWIGIFLVVCGLVVVGAADILNHSGASDSDTNLVITGDLLIIIAMIITASQMVYEEKFCTKYNVPPLQAVGWEGFFGGLTLGILLIPMYFINVGPSGIGLFTSDPDGRFENVIDAFCQLGNSPVIAVATIGNMISIAFFNFSGISVTRELSATTRMVLDSMRTLIIWIVSLALSWQKFNYLQIPGFLLLALGTAVYNGLLNGLAARICKRRFAESEPLIN